MKTVTILVLGLWGSVGLVAQTVKDPLASLVNVAARQAVLEKTTDPVLKKAIGSLHACSAQGFVEPPPGRMIIPDHYVSGSNGPVNPAEAVASRPYEAFEKRVDAGMNEYLAKGDQKEAACALDQMDAWAKAGKLLDYDREESRQAWYWVEWTLSGIGISESVLVNDAALNPEEQKRVIAWLDAASHKSVSFEKASDTGNNHHYWRALHAIVIGVVASDDRLFQFGVATYKQAIAEINAEGAFPKEMARHENAMGYQGFALEPLIVIAQAAERQGVDLYGYEANGHTIRDAVNFFGRAIENPELIKPYASETQKKVKLTNERLGEIPFYAAHFGIEGLPGVLVESLKEPVEADRLGGETSLLAGK